MPSCQELPPRQAQQFLHCISGHIKSVQDIARGTKTALKRLPDAEGSKAWYKKQMAIRNYDARMEMVVMNIWQIEPVAEGYLDYNTVAHVTDLVRKLCADIEALAVAANDRGIMGRDLKSVAQRMDSDVVNLAAA